MLRFTSHSNWVQETTKMVCLQPRMKRWKLHCLQRYWLQHPNWVKQPGLHLTVGTNRPKIPCLPRLLLVYKEKQPGLQCTKHPNRVIQPGLDPTACPHKLNQPNLHCVYGTQTEGSNQASTQPHARTNHKRRVYTVFEPVQGDAAQPPPTFSLYQKRTTHQRSSAPHKKEALSQLLPDSTPQQSIKRRIKVAWISEITSNRFLFSATSE